MKLARWTSKSKHGARPRKVHVTADGIKTACGALIPDHATLTRETTEWYLHTDCYNCAYRLWPEHGPADYICPANSRDFPPRRRQDGDVNAARA